MSYICLRDVVSNKIQIERICTNTDPRLIYYLEQNENKLNTECIKHLCANLYYYDDDNDIINFISKYSDKFDSYCLNRLFDSLIVRIVNKNNFNNLFNLIKNVFDKIKIDKHDVCIGVLYQICNIRDDIILHFLLEKSSILNEIDLQMLASNPSNLAIKIVKEQLYRIQYKNTIISTLSSNSNQNKYEILEKYIKIIKTSVINNFIIDNMNTKDEIKSKKSFFDLIFSSSNIIIYDYNKLKKYRNDIINLQQIQQYYV